jgi:mismatch-specific thymine-DNA glycosylase
MSKKGFQRFIGPNLDLLFVGLNPVEKSLVNGHYFSSFPSTWRSSLWYQLHHSGFSGLLYSEFEADEKIFGDSRKRLGITDLVDDVPTTNPNKLTKEDISRGRSRLTEEIHRYKPKVVCFLGKDTYRKFRGFSKKRPVEYGIQNDSEGESKIYLAAFPSSMDGSANEKIKILKDLYQLYMNYF